MADWDYIGKLADGTIVPHCGDCKELEKRVEILENAMNSLLSEHQIQLREVRPVRFDSGI